MAFFVKRIMALACCLHGWNAHAQESQCFGTVSKGRIEHSVQLPLKGSNYQAYSELAAAAGRTYVHGVIAGVLQDSYRALSQSSPDSRFVYGETGLAQGGTFKPHKTHQNGLSVDFFVPVRNAQNQPTTLPISASNHFGYDIEFDAQGRYEAYHIDFTAAAEHLYQLHQAAQRRGAGIALVIIDTAYLPRLLATPRGPYLRQHLPFMKGKPWVRHDEHYHVDFALPCKPM